MPVAYFYKDEQCVYCVLCVFKSDLLGVSVMWGSIDDIRPDLRTCKRRVHTSLRVCVRLCLYAVRA